MINALGWQIDNCAGYADAYRDVIHGHALKIGGGIRKFFLKAQKPGVGIKNDLGRSEHRLHADRN